MSQKPTQAADYLSEDKVAVLWKASTAHSPDTGKGLCHQGKYEVCIWRAIFPLYIAGQSARTNLISCLTLSAKPNLYNGAKHASCVSNIYWLCRVKQNITMQGSITSGPLSCAHFSVKSWQKAALLVIHHCRRRNLTLQPIPVITELKIQSKLL
jgi:hypothetical protein